jgi:hypothetical protein
MSYETDRLNLIQPSFGHTSLRPARAHARRTYGVAAGPAPSRLNWRLIGVWSTGLAFSAAVWASIGLGISALV